MAKDLDIVEKVQFFDPVTNIEEVLSDISKILSYSAKHDGFGLWTARLEETDEFIGWCALNHIELNSGVN